MISVDKHLPNRTLLEKLARQPQPHRIVAKLLRSSPQPCTWSYGASGDDSAGGGEQLVDHPLFATGAQDRVAARAQRLLHT